jgi:hypothetical protein
VDGPSDQEPGRRDPLHPRGVHRVSTQMHAVRTHRECDVEAIIDDHARPCSANRAEALFREAGKRTASEIALTHLNEMDARPCRRSYTLDERRLPGLTKTVAVRDQADDGGHVDK